MQGTSGNRVQAGKIMDWVRDIASILARHNRSVVWSVLAHSNPFIKACQTHAELPGLCCLPYGMMQALL